MDNHTKNNSVGQESYWQRAIDSELKSLAAVPLHNPKKTGSELFASLVRLASLAKGAGMREGELIPIVVQTCQAWDAPQGGLVSDREWVMMWRNAWGYARPRSRPPGPQSANTSPYGSLVKERYEW